MINFLIQVKMFRIFLILSLCFGATVRASGVFSVLSNPKSLSFKGNDDLQSEFVGDVLYASLGNSVKGDLNWSGLVIEDPFELPQHVVAVVVDGIDQISVNENAKTYPMIGNDAEKSLNTLRSRLESSNKGVADMNFDQLDEALVTFANWFGEAPAQIVIPKSRKSLKPELHSEDKQFLQTIAYSELLASKMASWEKQPNLMIVRFSVSPIAKAHGEKSAAMIEVTKQTAAVIEALSIAAHKASDGKALVVAIASKSDGTRVKREVEPPKEKGKNPLNLAEYYNEDYPVIFNIILWFMIVFGFSLLAICYAIGSMDPGRDSIIYRMTSTRMKKDN